MAITQLSAFLENTPGTLYQAVSAISDAGINLRALSVADTRDFGILRMIVSDVSKTKEVLGEYTLAAETKVIAVKMDDHAGALKNILKIIFLGYLVWKIIWAAVPELLTMCYGTIDDIFPCVSLMLKRLACYTAFGYVVIAVVDRIFQGRDYTKQLMMTKDEVKREYKEMEGSAEIKQAQRQFRDEILNGPEPAKATREADVVVTNPTHLAIGIRYRAEEAPLPKIVVAGADRIAKIIRETAVEEGIPIMEDISLARRLYALGKVEDYIPPELIEPVAEVLKWVKRLEQARREERELDEIAL
jgi:flagellar biosynthesis protein FlhB